MNKISKIDYLLIFIFIFIFPFNANCSNPTTAKLTKARIQIEFLEKAIINLKSNIRRYPSEEERLEILIKQPIAEKNWKGPYLHKRVPIDPWGNAYKYNFPSKYSKKDFELYSFGINGQDDNGQKDDITNWLETKQEYYGGISNIIRNILISISVTIIFLIIALLAKLSTNSIYDVTSRYTRATVAFFTFIIIAFFIGPFSDHLFPTRVATLACYIILSGFVICPIAGLISIIVVIIKEGYSSKL